MDDNSFIEIRTQEEYRYKVSALLISSPTSSYLISVVAPCYLYCGALGDQWHPTPVLLPGKSRGWRSLVGCSPWGLEESDMTERLHFHFSLSCTAEGNGNPLQCSCLDNPRDRGAWWAAVYGVAHSRTRLKQLSSSSSSINCYKLLSVALVLAIRFQDDNI